MTSDAPFDPRSIERPDPALFRYYLLTSLLTGPLAPFVLLPLWFRYVTLRYKFDDTGVSMKWGILFRREVYLTYRRIQDIHLTRNILQRWMGLAKISLQTASGSSQAEMAIEGVLEADQLRDFLYSQMRGAKDDQRVGNTDSATATGDLVGVGGEATVHIDRATMALVGIRDSLQKLVEQSNSGGDSA